MKRNISTILFGCLGTAGLAQNLVPNGSFEEYNYCPDHWSQFDDNVVAWSACGNSPDYFNACRDSIDLGVPLNLFGNQSPSDGFGYAGIATFYQNSPFNREIICAQLTEPLPIGVPVYLSMKVARGGYGTSQNMSAGWSSKGVGMRLSLEPLDWPPGSYPNGAHLYLEEVLLDTSDWTALVGEVISDSAYRYVSIGNFFEDSLSAPVQLDSIGAWASYVFVDDICVSLEFGDCDIVEGITSIGESMECSVVSPFSEQLYLTIGEGLEGPLEVRVFDVNGRLFLSHWLTQGQRSLEWVTADWANGLYLLSVQGSMGAAKPIRIVHVSP